MRLAGDVGGTKTLMALYEENSSSRVPLVRASFPSGEFGCFADVVVQFHRDHEALFAADPVTAAAVGVAGPVIDDEVRVTNLPWTVSRAALATTLNLPVERVRLLNDLEATANAIPHLLPEDLTPLNHGVPVAHAPIAVIAPGTGLGQAWLTWDGAAYRPHPSEGGHVDFAPCNQLQLDLLNFLYQRYDHVSFERVVSGKGIPAIYGFLKETGRAEEPEMLRDRLAAVDDQTPEILSRTGEFEICRMTLDVFVATLGAKCGNVALSLMAQGGVYLAGGIPPRILPELLSVNFLGPFFNKGRFSTMMSRTPVHVVLNTDTVLMGAAYATSPPAAA